MSKPAEAERKIQIARTYGIQLAQSPPRVMKNYIGVVFTMFPEIIEANDKGTLRILDDNGKFYIIY